MAVAHGSPSGITVHSTRSSPLSTTQSAWGTARAINCVAQSAWSSLNANEKTAPPPPPTHTHTPPTRCHAGIEVSTSMLYLARTKTSSSSTPGEPQVAHQCLTRAARPGAPTHLRSTLAISTTLCTPRREISAAWSSSRGQQARCGSVGLCKRPGGSTSLAMAVAVSYHRALPRAFSWLMVKVTVWWRSRVCAVTEGVGGSVETTLTHAQSQPCNLVCVADTTFVSSCSSSASFPQTSIGCAQRTHR